MNQKVSVISEGWLELESDPGLFTLLINDFGVQGVEVEEIYDLQKLLPGEVYGFIFLFKWLEGGRRSRRAKFELSTGVQITDEYIVNSVFFAHQLIQNSCATHAILSILMNSDAVDLGSMLTEFKNFTKDMSPENKGFSLNNSPELMLAHNKHASPDEWRDVDDDSEIGSTIGSTSSSAVTTAGSSGGGSVGTGGRSGSVKCQEAFHFASFLPLNGHLYEMDSLKPWPIDHGVIPDGIEWQQYFQQLITDRLTSANENNDSNEIRYNLMALIPCKIDKLIEKQTFLTSNRSQLLIALKALIIAIDSDVFRRVFQISSFSQRKKLTDFELMQAAEYLLLIESESIAGVSSLATSNNFDEPKEHAGKADVGVVATSADNVAELVCTSADDDSESVKLLSTHSIEDFEICCQRKVYSRRTTPTPTVGNNVDDAVDYVELSADQAACTSTSAKNAPGLRKIVKLRLASPTQEKETFTLREIVMCLKMVDQEITDLNRSIEDERSKLRQYEIDDLRRTHNYDSFQSTFMASLSGYGIVKKDGSKNGKRSRKKPAATKREQKSSTLQRKQLQQQQQQNNKRKLSK